MANNQTNPLSPLADVELSKEEQMQMLAELQSIMAQEEASLPSVKQHSSKYSIPSWLKSGIAGLAAVIIAGVAFWGIQHQHHGLPSTTTTTVHNKQHSAPNQPKQNLPSYPIAHFNPAALDTASFTTDQVGFVAGKNGIYKTTDGGKTWVQVYSSKDPILGIQAKYQPVGKEEYVVAFTKTYLVRSTDGKHFTMQSVGVNKDGGSGTNIEDVSLLDNNMIYLLNNGVVWVSDGISGALYRATPTDTVSSIEATWDANGMLVCYAVAGTAVYRTTDGGHHWTKIYSATIDGPAPWKSAVQVQGSHVAVLFYGGDAAMSQEAYILYESNDYGRTWNAVVDEGFFTPDYKSAKPLDNTVVGQYPGPFTMDSKGNVLMIGLDEVQGNITILTTITPEGKTIVHDPVGSSANSPNFDFLTSPIAVATPDGRHIFVVGSKNGRGVVEVS